MTAASPRFTTGTAPGAHPQAGHGIELQTRPLEFLRSLHKHGDLVEIMMGPEPAYVVCHPDLLHQVLTQDSLYDKGGVFYDKVRDTVGNGLGNCPHADHRRQRRLVQPAFTPAQLAQYGPAIEQEIAALTGSWQPGEVIDVYPALHGLYLRILARTVFSTQVGDETVERIQVASKATLTMMVRRMSEQPGAEPTDEDRAYDEAHDFLKGEVDRLIAECRAGGADHGGLLSLLVNGRDDDTGTSLTDHEIRDHVINLLLAGSETPAALVTWALVHLAEHPAAASRLFAEIDEVIGDRTPTLADVPALTYTSQFLTETLRLYPPAWMVTRITTAPAEIAGRTLPEGTTVVFSPLAVHHRADVYEQPEAFEPDRWLPGRATTPRRTAFATFGGGARRCIGDHYTMNETALTLATIAARWRARVAPGADVAPTTASGSLRPVNFLVELDPR